MRFITALLAGLLLASVSIGTAQAAAPSAVVLPPKGTLNPDGSVDITMKVRCNETQQAFEWSIDVRQGTIFGNAKTLDSCNATNCPSWIDGCPSAYPAATLPCNGCVGTELCVP